MLKPLTWTVPPVGDFKVAHVFELVEKTQRFMHWKSACGKRAATTKAVGMQPRGSHKRCPVCERLRG